MRLILQVRVGIRRRSGRVHECHQRHGVGRKEADLLRRPPMVVGVPNPVLRLVVLRQHPDSPQAATHQEFQLRRVEGAVRFLGNQLSAQLLDHLLSAGTLLVLRGRDHSLNVGIHVQPPQLPDLLPDRFGRQQALHAGVRP